MLRKAMFSTNWNHNFRVII